ncbi:glycine--tRNA ligase subunit beta [Psychrobium sp. 1_MG-2023]|uniref:glycine--tRNA ligase subunit beta n=1 Tax=Psychrobium sp. 1_MG-2023 TaxID=3062624 RepID=UPI002734EBBA|nr:glycine--tRNA ligase subunit beta [Psychrobium sp. 1_MG-2023]MDP2560514.1 glycine--tRNA ligase subunit beta [Psychrobium sp. 1_MG-2023]
MSVENLIIELGTEELPPKSLRTLATAFSDSIQAQLEKADIDFDTVKFLASPRRLAVSVTALATGQADKIVEKRGPAISSAFDADGNPTKAAQGWARSNGITVEQAERLKTDKGEWLLYKAEVKGQATVELIPTMVEQALTKLPIAKPMRWGNNSMQFIRPTKTLTILFGDQLVDATVLGCKSDRIIRGHRFHCDQELILDHADNYTSLLREQGFVIADYEERKALVKEQVIAAATKENGVAEIDDDLLEEVSSLVEWPVTFVGSFEDKFLDVPAEALIYTMKDNQKYFPLLDNDGKLMARFIFVSNIDSKEPEQVISGNEKVVRPRLADAEFFYNQDQKSTLESRIDSLDSILFQKQLGTLKEKSQRIAALAKVIATKIGANDADAERAGLLCKTDLMTDMVLEFPDVQGVMGMHYARFDGESEDVAVALNEQYMPRFAGDKLPGSLVSCSVALADKFDTLVGIFGIGQIPKGDKDPFALRRAAIGALRIIVEKDLDLDLVDLVKASAELYGEKLSNEVEVTVVDFMLGRFNAWYQDQNVDTNVVKAVMARRPTRPSDFNKRIEAVTAFRALEASKSLAAANKRVGNILAKTEANIAESVNEALLSEDAEKQLANVVAEVTTQLVPVFAASDYNEALTQLAQLKDPVDAFFDNVMVMCDDEAVKLNRLALLNILRNQFLNVADISLLQ